MFGRLRRGWLGNEYLHAGVIVVLALALMFWPAISQKRPLTTAALLYALDSLYHEVNPAYAASLSGENVISVDSSPYYLYYPYDIEATRAFRSGYFPLWNPYNAGGTPLLGSGQSLVFNPDKLALYLAEPVHFMRMYSLILVGHLWLAGFFMYVFMRLVRVSRGGAFMSAIAFMFCAFNLTHLQFTDVTAITLFPLLMVATEWLLQQRGGQSTVFLGIVVGLVVLSGHPEPVLFSITAAAIYYVVRVQSEVGYGTVAYRQIITDIGRGIIAGGIGIAVSLVYTLPFLEFTRNSVSYTTNVDASEVAPLSWTG